MPVKEQDPEKQKELFKSYLTDTALPHAAIIESHLEKNGTGFLVGSAVSFVLLFNLIITVITISINSSSCWFALANLGGFGVLHVLRLLGGEI